VIPSFRLESVRTLTKPFRKLSGAALPEVIIAAEAVTLLARRSRASGARGVRLRPLQPAVMSTFLALSLAPAILAILPILAPCRSARAAASPSEYEVKAAFLFNFAKFVEWPAWTFEQAKGNVIFTILGDDPFGPALERIARDERVQGRPIIIKRVRRPEDVGHSHILFIRHRAGSGLEQLIRSVSAPYRLVVGEDDLFAERGGCIGFFFEQRRIKFAVNLAATGRAGLKVSSKLLTIARVVRN
jgi:hypothetical protein